LSQKHILLLSPFAHPNIGGVESHLQKLIAYLTSKHYYVTLITYQPLTTKIKGLPYEKHPSFEVIRINWFGHNWFNKLEKYFPLVFAYLFPGLFLGSLKYYLNNYRKIDCIHAHGLAAAAVASILKTLHPKRIVLSTHAIYQFSRRPFLKNIVVKLFKHFDRILAVSEVSRQEIISMGINPSQVLVHPNWIDTKIFSPQKPISHSQLNLLFVGRFIPQKGILLILETAPKLPHINFHLVGSGELEPEVIRTQKNNSNIFYHGFLSQTKPNDLHQLINLYNQSDYLISPYLYDEGFSTTLIESIACGTKVIVPRRGSPPTFLSPETTVYLPKVPKTAQIINTLSGLSFKNPQSIQACRRFALSNFSSKNAQVIADSYYEN
jgi:glycosyltransferase involved in cell wall biosynthesis